MKTKKYITTDKHPELKEGLILKSETGQPSCLYTCDGMYIENDIKLGLKKGYIKEVQEPEFTRGDMIDFWNFAKDHDESVIANDGLDIWVMENHK